MSAARATFIVAATVPAAIREYSFIEFSFSHQISPRSLRGPHGSSVTVRMAAEAPVTPHPGGSMKKPRKAVLASLLALALPAAADIAVSANDNKPYLDNGAV